MSTPEIERRLSGLLQEHAEDAMRRTDTQDQLTTFEERHEHGASGRRTWWTAGVLATAAAAVVGLVLWVGADDEDRPQPAATDPKATALASRYLEGMYSPDLDRAEALLASDSELVDYADREEWRRDHTWMAAAGYTVADHLCLTADVTAAVTEVECTFSMHALGSAQHGRGPFDRNTLAATVADGELVRVEVVYGVPMNGFASGAWDPFSQWVARRHFEDLEAMYTDLTLGGVRQDPSALRLWEKRVAQYARSGR